MAVTLSCYESFSEILMRHVMTDLSREHGLAAVGAALGEPDLSERTAIFMTVTLRCDAMC